MNKPLRILHLEDQPDFSSLVSAVLEKERMGAQVMLVTDFAGYTAALESGGFDLIIADYMLPTCNGRQALEEARQKRPEIPFILLSGAIGEHAAVEILQSGATDYVLKSSIERLVPAIRRALRETEERSQRHQAEGSGRSSEQHYRLIFEGSPVPMWVADLKTGAILEANEASVRHYGYSRNEFVALGIKDICSREEATKLNQFLSDPKRAESGVGHAGLFKHRRKDGAFVDVDVNWSVIFFQDRDVVLTMAKDVTDLRRAAEALKKNQARLAAALRIARLGSWELDLVDLENLDRNKLNWSEETCRIFGVQSGQAPAPSQFFFNSVHPEDLRRIKEVLAQAFRSQEPYEVEYRILLPDGRERAVRGRAEFVRDDRGKPIQLRGIVMDITEQLGQAGAPAPAVDDGKAPAGAAKRPKAPKIGKPTRPAGRPGR